MRRPSIEDQYIRDLEPPPDIGDQGHAAEKAVIDFFKAHFPNMEIRSATKEEDSGLDQIQRGKRLDAVAYLDGKPALGLQITTATNQHDRAKKLSELKTQPFLRLPEMGRTDPAMPRALVFAEPKEVTSFIQNPDFRNHPELAGQVLDSTINSLRFDLAQTKNPQEIKRVSELLSTLETKRQELKKEQGKPD